MNEKTRGFLGLAMKAGALAVGDGRATERIRRGEAHLIIISSDASENTRKKYGNMSDFRQVPILTLDIDRFELGSLLGRDFAVTLAVCDKGFAEGLLSRENSTVSRKG